MLIVTGAVVVRPESLDEALAVSLEHVRRSRGEPGCLLHSVHRDVEDPNRLVFLERWASRDALDTHFQVPASGQFVAALSQLAVTPPTIDVYDTDPPPPRPAPPSTLHQVARHHRDLDQAEAFYRTVLGLPRIARFEPPGLAFFDLSPTRLLVEEGDPATNSVLYLRSDDIDADWARLVEAGVEAVAEPHLVHPDPEGVFGPPGGEEWMAFFRDPDGGLLALAQRKG